MGGRPPIVVAGAHRCGTTLLVELLGELGVFFGASVDPNLESYFFLRLNEWVLRRAGGAWDWPLPARSFLANERFAADALAVLAAEIGSHGFVGFTGRLGYLRTLGSRTDRRPWGWKDPRNVFTFGLWQRLFPGARLLYIQRNGVDAAHSLQTRESARWKDGATLHDYPSFRPLRRRLGEGCRLYDRLEGYLFSTRCLTLEESFRLWEEYSAQGVELLASYAGPKLCVRYEDLIADPTAQLEAVTRFCGLDPTPADMARAAAGVRRGRAFAFLRDEHLGRFYREVRHTPWMQRLGYGEIAAGESS